MPNNVEQEALGKLSEEEAYRLGAFVEDAIDPADAEAAADQAHQEQTTPVVSQE